jgi:transposase InsO family protein
MKHYGQQRTLKRTQRKRRAVKTPEQLQGRIEQEALRNQRRQQRLERRQADEAWRTTKQNRRTYQQQWRKLSRKDKQSRRAEAEALWQQWQQHKAARRADLAHRQAQDEAWRQRRLQLQQPQADLSPALPTPHKWLAILVIVDNGTRRCLGLPLFTAGAHVTSELVVTALRSLLPVELQFLISDNGPQFKAELFAQLAETTNFIHIRISPGRPCTNGIAERFVQTLKTWLATHSWSTPAEMEALLAEFIAFYNDRPHQGAELKGLSPNEYAHRLASCSTC